eukprot:gene12698-15014_t
MHSVFWKHGVYALLCFFFTSAASGCKTDEDCSLNGVCDTVKYTCTCDSAWTGYKCELLNFLPTPKHGGYKYSDNPFNTSSWGGATSYDPETKKWYMWVTEISKHCGIDSWESNSQIVRAASSSPYGPFVRVDVQFPVWSHEVNIARGPQGEYVAYFAADIPAEREECTHCRNGRTSQKCERRSLRKEHNTKKPVVKSDPLKQLASGLGKVNTQMIKSFDNLKLQSNRVAQSTLATAKSVSDVAKTVSDKVTAKTSTLENAEQAVKAMPDFGDPPPPPSSPPPESAIYDSLNVPPPPNLSLIISQVRSAAHEGGAKPIDGKEVQKLTKDNLLESSNFTQQWQTSWGEKGWLGHRRLLRE